MSGLFPHLQISGVWVNFVSRAVQKLPNVVVVVAAGLKHPCQHQKETYAS